MSQTEETTRELLEIATRNAAEYFEEPVIKGIIVTGSVARGNTDFASDIDTILFTDGPVSQEIFDKENKRAEESGGGFYGGSTEEGFGVYRYVEGVRIDMGFTLISSVEELITDVIEKYDTEPEKQLIIDGIRRSIVLKGKELITGWKEKTDTYPDELGKAMIKKHLGFDSRWVLEKMGADRDDRLFLYERFLEDIKRFYGVLFGLNRQYHPMKLKGMALSQSLLPIAPKDMLQRVESLFNVPLAESILEYEKLVEEIFALVEEHEPEIDVAPARKRFEMKLTQRDAS